MNVLRLAMALLLVASGETCVRAAVETSLDYQVAVRHVRAMGFARPRGGAVRRGIPNRMPSPRSARMVELRQKGLTYSVIAERLGVRADTVYCVVRRWKPRLAAQVEARRAA